MANSTSNIDNLIASQAGKEITANAFFDAASPIVRNGRRAFTTGGLVFGIYGGNVLNGGTPTFVANSTLTLTASTTTYIEAASDTGVVYQNVAGFTPGRIPLYSIVTGPSTITSYTDLRVAAPGSKQTGSLVVAGNTGFQYNLSNCDIVTLTGTPSAGFTVLIPARGWVFVIRNATGQAASFGCGATNSVSIAAGKVATIMTDGADIYRVTADL